MVSHHAAGFFGVEGDDFVFAVLFVFEDRGDEFSAEGFLFDGGEVFVRGEVYDEVRA